MKGAALCLICCLAAFPAYAAPSLVGIWFGQGQPYDKQSMYIDRFMGGGKFRSEFRDCRKGKAEDSNEEGTWSVKGDILTINVERRNGVVEPRTETYRLTSVTPTRFKDVFLPLNFPFDEHRVDEKFVMPDCQLVS
jgi:hypothetical protein